MIAAYLLPYPARGVRAPYLWVFYKLLAVLRERALFVVGEDYLRDPAGFAAEGRWELNDHTRWVYGFTAPTAETVAGHRVETLPGGLFDGLLAECANNPIEVFRRMLTQRLPALEAAFEAALERGGGTERIEAIVTWHNCPSLSAVAERRGIPVVHLEAGPLRIPLYRPTAYCDFSGVNGNTEAGRRYLSVPARTGPAIDLERLRRFFFLPGDLPPKDPAGYVGLALQVEDDSNLVAFGNGFDNQAAVVHARLFHGNDGPLLVRRHPGSLFSIAGYWFTTDTSYDSLEFIQHCKRIVTINSSLGLEALLLGTPATVLGDASYRYVLDADDERERIARLAFFLFAYLVPEQLMFDLDYLRFRLTGPHESAIVARHLAAYTGWAYDGTSPVWALIDAALAGVAA